MGSCIGCRNRSKNSTIILIDCPNATTANHTLTTNEAIRNNKGNDDEVGASNFFPTFQSDDHSCLPLDELLVGGNITINCYYL